MPRPRKRVQEKKSKWLTIRLDERTYSAYQRFALVANETVANWARTQIALAADRQSPISGRPPRVVPVDPRLVRQLRGIGNNLNQIARAAHLQKLPRMIDLLSRLVDIERALRDIRQMYQPEMNEIRQTTLYRLWLAPLIVGLSLSLGLLLGSAVSLWALTSMIVERVQTLDRHQQAIQTMRAAGIETHPSKSGLYLITPHKISKPIVYTSEQYPGRWIIKIPEH